LGLGGSLPHDTHFRRLASQKPLSATLVDSGPSRLRGKRQVPRIARNELGVSYDALVPAVAPPLLCRAGETASRPLLNKKGESMNKKKVVRAWKDPVYRASLSAEERRNLPANPAGEIDSEDTPESVMGGFTFGSGCASAGCFTLCATSTCTCTCTCTCICITHTCYCA
jgi:mersacidin/lichenicidin family type 2 lantibiotic